MNQPLVSNIMLPNISVLEDDSIKKRSNDLSTENADPIYVDFVIDNLAEVINAYHQDFCCNDRIFFTIQYGKEKKDMTFDFSALRHLIALPANKNAWKTTAVVRKLVYNHPTLTSVINSRQPWLDQIVSILHYSYKQDIKNHECFSNNSSIEKLNWKKMAVKIFSLINVGLLETGTTFLYVEERNMYSNGKTRYLLIRSLRNGDLENVVNCNDPYYNKQLAIVFVEDVYNGYVELEPESIMIIDKPLNQDKTRDKKCFNAKNIELLGSKFKFKAIPTIMRVSGERYVDKGKN